MPAPDSPTASLSKAQVFLRRLASTLVLWTGILAAMFSGYEVITDGVFVLIIAFLALTGLVKFTGWPKNAGCLVSRSPGSSAACS